MDCIVGQAAFSMEEIPAARHCRCRVIYSSTMDPHFQTLTMFTCAMQIFYNHIRLGIRIFVLDLLYTFTTLMSLPRPSYTDESPEDSCMPADRVFRARLRVQTPCALQIRLGSMVSQNCLSKQFQLRSELRFCWLFQCQHSIRNLRDQSLYRLHEESIPLPCSMASSARLDLR